MTTFLLLECHPLLARAQDAESFLAGQVDSCKPPFDDYPHENTDNTLYFKHLVDQIPPSSGERDDAPFVRMKGLWASPTDAVAALGINLVESNPSPVQLVLGAFQTSVSEGLARLTPHQLRKAMTNRFAAKHKWTQAISDSINLIIEQACAAGVTLDLRSRLEDILQAHSNHPEMGIPCPLGFVDQNSGDANVQSQHVQNNQAHLRAYLSVFALMRYRDTFSAAADAHRVHVHSRKRRHEGFESDTPRMSERLAAGQKKARGVNLWPLAGLGTGAACLAPPHASPQPAPVLV